MSWSTVRSRCSGFALGLCAVVSIACGGDDEGPTASGDGTVGTSAADEGSGGTTAGPGDETTSPDPTKATTSSDGGEADTAADDSTGSGVDPLIEARPYAMHVPASYDPAVPTPLVLSLHGYGATGQLQAIYFGLTVDAEEHGYLVAIPDGTVDASGSRFWNATDACCNFGGDPVDDVAYLGAVLDDVAAQYNVDAARVYVIGHSNGGFMAHRLACDIGDRLAAVVSLAGATWNDPTQCPAASAVNVLQIHGTADATIAYDGGSTGGAAYPSAPQTVATWADLDGCDPAPVDDGTVDLETSLPGAETVRQTYAGCMAGGDVGLWTIEGGSHIPALGESFADEVWAWFEAHPKP